MGSVSRFFSRDRRFAKRHDIETALRVRVWKSGLPEERAQSLNLSPYGIFFATNSRFSEGEVVEILLKMPQEITGEPATEWRCTGHVVRVERADFPRGKFGVGVQFYCYEASRPSHVPLPQTVRLTRDIPVTP